MGDINEISIDNLNEAGAKKYAKDLLGVIVKMKSEIAPLLAGKKEAEESVFCQHGYDGPCETTKGCSGGSTKVSRLETRVAELEKAPHVAKDGGWCDRNYWKERADERALRIMELEKLLSTASKLAEEAREKALEEAAKYVEEITWCPSSIARAIAKGIRPLKHK